MRFLVEKVSKFTIFKIQYQFGFTLLRLSSTYLSQSLFLHWVHS